MTKKTERKSCKNCKLKDICLVCDHIDDAFDYLTLNCTTVKTRDKALRIQDKLYKDIAELCKLYQKRR